MSPLFTPSVTCLQTFQTYRPLGLLPIPLATETIFASHMHSKPKAKCILPFPPPPETQPMTAPVVDKSSEPKAALRPNGSHMPLRPVAGMAVVERHQDH